MTFSFEIDDAVFMQEDGVDFNETIRAAVIEAIADRIYYSEIYDGAHSAIAEEIRTIIKDKSSEICESVVERVADKIAHKKQILELTPKVSALAAADKENVVYFEAMIDRAIANRFGKQR